MCLYKSIKLDITLLISDGVLLINAYCFEQAIFHNVNGIAVGRF